ncbi:hypothetical protein D3C73_859060 [compost metagenome]
MDTDVLDKSGNTNTTFTGYASASSGIVDVTPSGKALKVFQNQGVSYQVRQGGEPLFAQDKWSFEFDIYYNSVTTFRHDCIFAMYNPDNSLAWYLMNDQHRQNRLTLYRAADGVAYFVETTFPADRAWYNYKFTWDEATKTLSLFRDGQPAGSIALTWSLAVDQFDIWYRSVDYFDGYLKNIKLTAEG